MTMPKAMKAKARKMGMYALLGLAVMFSGFNLASAYSGTAQTVIEHVENFYGGSPADSADLGAGDELLGASANRPVQYVYDYVNGFFVNGRQVFDTNGNLSVTGDISVSDDFTVSDDLHVVGDATVSTTFAVTGTSTIGVLDVNGAAKFDAGALTFNDDSGDYDVRMEGNGEANLFFLDAGNDLLGVNTSTPNAQLQVYQDDADQALWITQMAGSEAVYVDQNGDNGGLIIDSEATTQGEGSAGLSVVTGQGAPAFHAEYGSDNSGKVVMASNPSSAAFSLASFYYYRNVASSTSAVPMMYIFEDHADEDQHALSVENDGYGNGIFVNQDNYGRAVNIDADVSSANDLIGLWVNAANAGAGGSYAAIFEAGRVGIGTTTPDSELQVIGTVSTTLMVGAAGKTGCIELQDTDAAGFSYLVALNGTLTTTSTKPAGCK